AGAEAADWLAVFDHIGHHIDLGLAFDKAPARLLYRGPVERAEAAAERDQIIVTEALPAEQQNEVIDPGAMNCIEFGSRNRAQIHSCDFRAQSRPGRYDLQCHVNNSVRSDASDIAPAVKWIQSGLWTVTKPSCL